MPSVAEECRELPGKCLTFHVVWRVVTLDIAIDIAPWMVGRLGIDLLIVGELAGWIET